MANFHVSTCLCIVLLLLACHRFPFCNGDVGETQTHISDIGPRYIGPHRQKRSGQIFTNEVNVDEGKDGQQKNLGHPDHDDDSDEDDDEEYDDSDDSEDNGDDQDSESEGDSKSLSSNSRVKENLNLLKNTRKSLARYVREENSLDKLMAESSGLAKEVGQVFHIMTKRETGLEKEMESLKEALREAVVTLKSMIKDEERKRSDNRGDDSEEQKQTLARKRRHFNHQKNQYRACVEIEPYREEGMKMAEPPPSNEHQQSVKIHEYMPSHVPHSQTSGNNLAHQSSAANNANNGAPPVGYTPSYQAKASYPNPAAKYPPSENKAGALSGKPEPRTSHTSMKYLPPSSGNNNNAVPASSKNSASSYDSSRNSNQAPNRQLPPSRPLPMVAKSQAPQFQASSQQNANSIPNNQNNNNNYASASNKNMDDVDLREVYWLRLDPNRKQEMLHEKVDTILKEKQMQGKDVLVIPVAHKFRNTDEVKNGFLRAVRIPPKALNRKHFRSLRSLQVLEI